MSIDVINVRGRDFGIRQGLGHGSIQAPAFRVGNGDVVPIRSLAPPDELGIGLGSASQGFAFGFQYEADRTSRADESVSRLVKRAGCAIWVVVEGKRPHPAKGNDALEITVFRTDHEHPLLATKPNFVQGHAQSMPGGCACGNQTG